MTSSTNEKRVQALGELRKAQAAQSKLVADFFAQQAKCDLALEKLGELRQAHAQAISKMEKQIGILDAELMTRARAVATAMGHAKAASLLGVSVRRLSAAATPDAPGAVVPLHSPTD